MARESGLPEGAIALVTGASSGIGHAVVQRLIGRGCRVICAARNAQRLAAAFADQGEQTHLVPLDVTDAEGVAGLIESLPEAWRNIDVLVANAGSDVGGRQPFVEGAMADWAQTIETNVVGMMTVCHAVLPGMIERGRGHVVTLGSIAGIATYAGGAVYAASKHAVQAFTESLCKDHSRDPIRITEILPAMVRTGFAAARHRGDRERAESFYDSFPTTLVPEDVADVVLFALEQPTHVNLSQIVVTPTGDKWP